MQKKGKNGQMKKVRNLKHSFMSLFLQFLENGTVGKNSSDTVEGENVTNQNLNDDNTKVPLELKAVSKKWYARHGRLT